MTDLTRREAVGLLAFSALAAACDAPGAVERASRDASSAGDDFEPRFFTPDEWEMVRLLVDYIIPADDRSGSATDAKVPEFMDFILVAFPDGQTPMRGGLAWIDSECAERWGKTFVECSDEERRGLLDDIAFPDRAPLALSQGAAFFAHFRDLTASGFWSSKMGVEDVQYMGNTAVAKWEGCPDEAVRKVGVGKRAPPR